MRSIFGRGWRSEIRHIPGFRIQATLQVTFLYWRIVVLEAGKEDLRQRLDDRDQTHALIQAKLQVTFL